MLILLLCPGCAHRYTTKLFKAGVKHCKNGRFEDGRNCLIQLYHAGDNSYWVLSALANVYLQLQLYDSAKFFLDKAFVDPRSVQDDNLQSNMAYYLWMNHLPHEALEHINRAIELKPREADFYMYRGLVYSDLFYNDLACADFKKAVELGSKMTSMNADSLFKEDNCESWVKEELEGVKRRFKPK
ncbi:MAG: hypothetical protein HRU69_01605 [Flammeovirgaceae bacterium]|nr:MAG: hypothetical protein HRU69_01605 [Flammeovirgaceae bacterium]